MSIELTDKEKLLLWGLNKHPNATLNELSDILSLKQSTTAAIKNRLMKQHYFFELNIPMLNRLGFEMLGVGIMKFNSLISMKHRFGKTVELMDNSYDLFLAVEGQNIGLAFGFFRDYTNFKKFEEDNTIKLAGLDFLEGKLPIYVLFPFKHSHIRTFFDFWRLLDEVFSLNNTVNTFNDQKWFFPKNSIDLTDKEKLVLLALTEYPNATLKQIGDSINLSRHSVGRIKSKLFEMGLIKKLYLPNFLKLGLNILALYYITFNPKNPPKNEDFILLNSKFSLFFANTSLEAVLVASYRDFKEYLNDKMQKISFLKEKNLIIEEPMIHEISVEKMQITKAFDASMILRTIFDITQPIFDLQRIPSFRSLKETL